MGVDLVVVSYKTDQLLQEFIDSYYGFLPSTTSTLTVVDVDTKGSERFWDKEFDYVPVDSNCGYNLACNLGATFGDSDVIAFFNADTRFINDTCVDRCVEFLENHDEVGIVGPLQYSSSKKATHAGIMGSLEVPSHRGWQSDQLQLFRKDEKAVTVSGSAFFVKRKLWNDLTDCRTYREQYPNVQGAFLPTAHFYGETAASYHAQAHGHEVWYLGSAEMIHEWAQSPPADIKTNESRQMFRSFCDHHKIPHD